MEKKSERLEFLNLIPTLLFNPFQRRYTKEKYTVSLGQPINSGFYFFFTSKVRIRVRIQCPVSKMYRTSLSSYHHLCRRTHNEESEAGTRQSEEESERRSPRRSAENEAEIEAGNEAENELENEAEKETENEADNESSIEVFRAEIEDFLEAGKRARSRGF